MSKTKLRTNSPTSTQVQMPEPDVKFKEGDRATINSTHPLFPGMICTVTALPSPDAVIVELEDGIRQRLLLEYLDLLEQDKVSNLSTTSVDIIEPLTPDEERERHRLELKVERAFYEAGCALRDLRDKRLYRSTHQTFEQYCKDRFGFARRHPYRLIDAVAVVDNLCPIRTQDDAQQVCPNQIQILPTNLEQVRHMTSLQPEEQRTVWQQAIDLADGKVPTGKIVKGIVERLKEKPLYQAKDFCFVGDVFILTRLCDEERKYNGYPCVAVELKHFTIDVDVYDATLAVKPENLKKIDSPDVCRQLPAIINRIKRVRSAGQLDRGANSLLKHLGQQMYLTEVEEGLLQWLENHYGV